MDRLKYSLLVPCYNAEEYIESFITNLRQLKGSFDEIIFYDDASNDKTLQILKSNGLNVIEGQSNSGPGYARNRLAEAAKGDYIHFHDIDDEFNPDFLQLIGNNVKIQTDVVLGNADWIDAFSRTTLIRWRYKNEEIVNDPVRYFLSNPLGIINTIYKRNSFLAVKGFNERLHCWEDSDLHVRMAMRGYNFLAIDEVLAYSIRHNRGISQNQNWCWSCRFQFLNDYKDTVEKKHLPALGAEYEKVARALFDYNNFKKSIAAFKNSIECGHDAPSTNNGFLIRFKSISPISCFLFREMLLRLKKH